MHYFRKIGFFILLTGLCFTSSDLSAAVINSKSCNRADVQNAIDTARDGDKVIIPAGKATWTSPAIVSGKSISIIGAGIDKTTITDKTSKREQCFFLDSKGKSIRLSGLTFNGNPNDYTGHVKAHGGKIRLDHIRFNTSYGKKSVSVWGSGLIDSCIFEGDSRGISSFGGGGSTWRNVSAYAPGTNNGLFIETCTFKRRGTIVAGYNGSIYVFRHNIVKNGGRLDVHGADSQDRSGLYIEVYNNKFTNSGSAEYTAINIRGGSAIIFSNTFDAGKFGNVLRFINYRSCYNKNKGSNNYHKTNANQCDASSTNPLDGKWDSTGWPCKDQIGRGPNQDAYPAYEWNNKDTNGKNINYGLGDPWGCSNPSMADHIKENRDYFNDKQLPGYFPYTYPHPYTKDNYSADSSPEDDGSNLTLFPPSTPPKAFIDQS